MSLTTDRDKAIQRGFQAYNRSYLPPAGVGLATGPRNSSLPSSRGIPRPRDSAFARGGNHFLFGNVYRPNSFPSEFQPASPGGPFPQGTYLSRMDPYSIRDDQGRARTIQPMGLNVHHPEGYERPHGGGLQGLPQFHNLFPAPQPARRNYYAEPQKPNRFFNRRRTQNAG